MRRSWWVALALFAVATCNAPVESTGSVQGYLVFNLEEGVEPVSLEGITILVEGPLVETAVTDQNGGFVVASLEPGNYAISADLQLFTLETNAKVTVEVEAGEHMTAPELVVTPAGSVRGHLTVEGGADPAGFRLQILGTGLAAVADELGDFVVHRVPGKATPGYELLAERADIGSARRAGIVVVPFEETNIGTLIVVPGGSGTANTHPHFDVDQIEFTPNGTPLEDAIVPLPYLVPEGFARRFDQVALGAPGSDPDGDALSYEWSASAGTLLEALTADARWRPDEYAGSQATLSVTIRDGHGGIARMSSDIEILDVFAGSAHRHGERVAHSYRVEGGPWRIDLVTLARAEIDEEGETVWLPDEAETLIEISTTSDPRPLLFDQQVVFRDNGDLMLLELTSGATDSLGFRHWPDTVANPTVVARPPELWFVSEESPFTVTGYDVESGDSWEAAVCEGTCLRLAADRQSGGFVAMYGFDTFLYDSGALRTANATIGSGLALYGGAVAFVSRDIGFNGRSVVSRILPLGTNDTVYDGYYDIAVWCHQGRDILITEQEYRALRHPPFVRWLDIESGLQGDYRPSDLGWMVDRAHDVNDGIGLVRHVTRADWPEAFDQSRSEIARVDLARATQ